MTTSLTQFGFQFGPALVQRLVEYKGEVIMSVTAQRQALEVRVTRSGLIRAAHRKPHKHDLERIKT